MFRRKEESATDSTDSTHTTNATSANGAHSQESTTSASQPVQSAASQPAAYAPSAVSARTASEPSRPVASAMAYRPTPIAEFNRNIARAGSDTTASRTSTASQTSSLLERASVTEKSAPAKSNRRVLTVGNDILLKGEIATCDRLVIEGRVEAKLSEVHTVEIAECGSFKGTAEVEDAEISGVFEGDLIVRNRIVIYATGEVRGNISYGEIEIERGGRLTGQIKTVASASAKGKSLDESKASRLSKETVAA